MNKTLRTVAIVPILGATLLPTLWATQGIAHAQKTKNAVTSKDVEENVNFDKPFKPIDATMTFAPSDLKIYATYDLGKPIEAYGRSVWSTVDVASMQPGMVISDMRTAILPNLQYARFSFTQANAWPAGRYKVDLYANEKMVKTLFFSVQ